MSDQYLGEIRIVGFNFAPSGWAMCNGQLLQIAQNNALFALLGVLYGGDGIRTFGLPNLQSRFPIGMGTGAGLSPYTQGQMGGVQQVTLTTQQLPTHFHNIVGMSTAATAGDPTGAYLATTQSRTGGGQPTYVNNVSNQVTMAQMCQPAGNNQPFATVPPYLALNFIIALQGIFPPRS